MTTMWIGLDDAGERWSLEQAVEWGRRQPWHVGCNYLPRTAGNQLEMFQAPSFDPATIAQELTWAADAGLNRIRVFLHDLLWTQDAPGLLERFEQVLALAAERGLGVMPVLFDSVWHPFPQPGRQVEPEPGVHNSTWVQSPGVAALREPERFAELEPYVRGVVAHFREDPRIVVWDIWNEPDNANVGSYGPRDLGPAKADLVAPLMVKAFAWARSARPTQPLTTGLWQGDWSRDENLRLFERLQLALSDVISFHCYEKAPEMAARLEHLGRFGRPLLCTEYMARPAGSTFAAILPLLHAKGVGAYHWGLVRGRSQTHLPWESWQQPCSGSEPPRWHHDLLQPDGTPHDPAELALLQRLAADAARPRPA